MNIDWEDHPRTVDRPCPVCGSRAAKQVRLTVDSALAGEPRLRLLGCAACGSAFYEHLNRAPYDESSFGTGFLKYYIELGAGLDTMVAPLYRLDPGRVRNYLEIGCGFGFSLDYARHVFGWTVKGMDPSPIAAAGRAALGLDIDSAYLASDTNFDVRFDLVMCSEVIEHLPAPAELIRSMARTLAGDGALTLTTPNVRALRRDAPFGVLLPILAPSFHLILYSPESLELILRENGFPHVRVWEYANTLHAVASLRPAAPPREAAVDRAAYRRYLSGRVRNLQPDSPVADGLTYRLFKELVNAGDFRGAVPVYKSLRDSWRRVYRIDIGRPAALAFEPETQPSFDDFSRRYPFNLCCTLYFKGMCEFVDRRDYPRAIEYFRAAVRAGTATATQLASVFAVDGEMEHLIWQARVHALYGLVEVDAAAAVAEFALLCDPPPSDNPADRFRRLPAGLVETTRNDLFVRLVRGNAVDQARTLLPKVTTALCGETGIPDQLAAALAALAGDRRGEFSRARRWLRTFRAALSAPVRRIRGLIGSS